MIIIATRSATSIGSRVVVSTADPGALDRLAREGLLFNRAYCTVAICHPSRAALLRPDRGKNKGGIKSCNQPDNYNQ